MRAKNEDSLGDLMKAFESSATFARAMKGIPLLARLDGRAFHSFAKGLQRPYDERLSNAMVETTKFLVARTHALVGYTQSDEISLLWHVSPESNSNFIFDGKIFKLTSSLSSLATVKFFEQIQKNIPEKAHLFPTFDCRVWQVPTKELAADVFRWREFDATKNSVSMAAHSLFSHKSLQGMSSKEMKDRMINEASINWNNYPTFFKRGTYVKRKQILVELDQETIDKIPEKYRPDPGDKVARSIVDRLEMPRCSSISNFVDVLFDNKEPIIFKE